jgi:hypothetical protein
MMSELLEASPNDINTSEPGHVSSRRPSGIAAPTSERTGISNDIPAYQGSIRNLEGVCMTLAIQT